MSGRHTYGLVAHELDDLSIVVTFTPPPGRKYPKTLKLLLTPKENKTYSVCHHSLPNSIPVQQLEAEFLGDRIGEDGKDGVRKFVTALSQYTRAFFIRYNHVSILEEAKMFDSRIHTNSDCTLVSLLIEVAAEAEAGMSRFEFVLEYKLLEIYPHEVKVRFVDGVETGKEIKEQLQEASIDMKTRRPSLTSSVQCLSCRSHRTAEKRRRMMTLAAQSSLTLNKRQDCFV
ncbi:uncharacterized protein LOC134778075 [Penaeus indicus]|uniref:uncharacterized protein LOC134778075 n=1 Tax=Penaeus indicus TaxID=29960 RepID=UPI00300C87DD